MPIPATPRTPPSGPLPRFAHDFLQRCLAAGTSYEFVSHDRADVLGRILYLLPSLSHGRRGTVVLMHGTGNDLFYPCIETMERLTRSGYAVTAADLPGHGAGCHSTLTPQHLRAFPDALIEALQPLTLPRPISAIGHSLGGALALLASAEADTPWSREIASLTLVAVPTAPPSEKASWQILAGEMIGLVRVVAKGSHRSVYGHWDLLPAVGSFRGKAFPVRGPGGEDLRRHGKYLQLIRRFIEDSPLLPAADLARGPVQLVYGSCDRIAPAEHGQALARRLGPRGSLALVPGATHLEMLFSSVNPQPLETSS